MKNNMPLWVKYCIFYNIGIVLIVLMIIGTVLIRGYSDKRNVTITNLDNITYFTENELNSKLKNIEEDFGGLKTSDAVLKAQNSTAIGIIQGVLEMLLADNSDVIAVFYLDNDNNGYSAGETVGDLNYRLELMKKVSADTKGKKKNFWFYDKTDRGYNACVLYHEVTYVDNNFRKKKLGKMLVYTDLTDLNQHYFSSMNGSVGILFTDTYGRVVAGSDKELVGKVFSEEFTESNGTIKNTQGKKYIYEERTSAVEGWKSICYHDSAFIFNETIRLVGIIIATAILGLIIMTILAYFVMNRLGSPIVEFARSIKLTNEGEIQSVYASKQNEIKLIETAFDNIKTKLIKQVELNNLKEIELKNAMLKMYEMQMNPHFLFNTLQIIQMLNIMERNDDVNDALAALGDILRFNLRDENEVKICEEVANIRSYLGIMEYKYGEGLCYDIIVDGELSNCKTVKFLLQPFVENSFRYAFSKNNKQRYIAVIIKKVFNDVAVIISDNGTGIDNTKLTQLRNSLHDAHGEPLGIGIKNVDSRIKLLYGTQYGVDIFCRNGTQVVIHLPVVHEEGRNV